MKKVTFITGNQKKLQQAKNILDKYNIEITNVKIDTPEIQSLNCEEIARFSAKYASEKLGKPVVVSDAGFYIRALNGFPGPFVKYMNRWFTAENLLSLMIDKTDRAVEAPVCVAYCEPGKDPVSFLSENYGTLATLAAGEGSTMDTLYIPNGYKVTMGTLGEDERLSLWSPNCWVHLAEYLQK